jgi:tRNA(Ile)-lysidine synthase
MESIGDMASAAAEGKAPGMRLPAAGDAEAEAWLAAWEEETFAFLAAMDFRPAGATLVLAVSGGADSMALLEFWARAGAARFGCRIAAVHVHHGLRAAADLDQALVEGRCRALGVPLRVFRLAPGSRRSRESVEMWARRERYRCFEEAAAAWRCDPGAAPGGVFVLTAHHRDDLVETVFQRLGRGTGVRGLAGIPFRREPGIVRPFLDRSRAGIEAYLAGIGGAWREDESNRDPSIDRNWYRHRLLPAWREREAGLDGRVLALALRVQGMGGGLLDLEDDAGLLRRDAAGDAFLPAEDVEARLAEGDVQSLRHWLGRLAGAVTGGKAAIGEEMVREMLRQWRLGTRKLRVSAGAGAWLERRKHGFYWKKLADRSPGAETRGKKGCPVPGQRIILDNGHGRVAWTWSGKTFTFTVRRYARPADLRFPAASEGRAIFDADLISCTLLVRTRKDGDRFSPLGVRSESRKLKVFLSEEQIPVGIRDEIPLVFSSRCHGAAGEETLAWVPGYGISDFFKVGPETARILEMELTCRNP